MRRTNFLVKCFFLCSSQQRHGGYMWIDGFPVPGRMTQFFLVAAPHGTIKSSSQISFRSTPSVLLHACTIVTICMRQNIHVSLICSDEPLSKERVQRAKIEFPHLCVLDENIIWQTNFVQVPMPCQTVSKQNRTPLLIILRNLVLNHGV